MVIMVVRDKIDVQIEIGAETDKVLPNAAILVIEREVMVDKCTSLSRNVGSNNCF